MAVRLGLNEAIILQHFYYWHSQNEGNESMQRDGRTWFFLSAARIQKVFPYLTERKIRTAIDHLVDNGLVVKQEGKGFNRSIWYALTEAGLSFFYETLNLSNKMSNASDEMLNASYVSATSIDSNIDNKKNIKDNNYIGASRFSKPSLDEVKAYADERCSAIDPEVFYDWYESNGWKVGKNPMKDWRAAFRTWERKEQERGTGRKENVAPKRKESTFEKNLRTIDRMFGTDYHNNYYGNGNRND